MAIEYERMRQLAKVDPGTSGDQGEENWAELLRQWLPSTFHVVTKGRIIPSGGPPSPQVDVLILSPYYPQGLISNKLYIAAGVLAAFECKRTLRREHIFKAAQTSADIGALVRSDQRVPHEIIFGLLAHSHQIPSKRRTAAANLSDALTEADLKKINDPRDCIDFICVPSLGTWSLMRVPLSGISTSYMGPGFGYTGQGAETDSIARFLTSLLRRLGRIDRSLALIAEYFDSAGLFGTGQGTVREWHLEEIPDELRQVLY